MSVQILDGIAEVLDIQGGQLDRIERKLDSLVTDILAPDPDPQPQSEVTSPQPESVVVEESQPEPDFEGTPPGSPETVPDPNAPYEGTPPGSPETPQE